MKRNIYVQLSGIVLAMLMLTQCSTSKNTTKGDNNDKKNAPISATSVVANALQGNWQFDYFTMVNTDKTILFPMQVPSLNFDPKEKKFSGNAGCNSISGTYQCTGNSLKFVQPMMITRMSCNAAGEKTFIEYLNTVTKFVINGNSLELIADTKPIIMMKRVAK
ncbi:MAG: META domain-containing protein [Bacteroidetes bacterium]|jgi:heat shock protein HslJ|nr:META domain-containing protein [Bacteroidota bacterium]